MPFGFYSTFVKLVFFLSCFIGKAENIVRAGLGKKLHFRIGFSPKVSQGCFPPRGIMRFRKVLFSLSQGAVPAGNTYKHVEKTHAKLGPMSFRKLKSEAQRAKNGVWMCYWRCVFIDKRRLMRKETSGIRVPEACFSNRAYFVRGDVKTQKPYKYAQLNPGSCQTHISDDPEI